MEKIKPQEPASGEIRTKWKGREYTMADGRNMNEGVVLRHRLPHTLPFNVDIVGIKIKACQEKI